MTTFRFVTYPIHHFHGVNKYNVPEGTAVLNAKAFENSPDVINIITSQPVREPGEEPVLEELRIMCIAAGGEVTEPDEPEYLDYINTVVWDNGHRVHHLFEVAVRENELEDMLGLLDDEEQAAEIWENLDVDKFGEEGEEENDNEDNNEDTTTEETKED